MKIFINNFNLDLVDEIERNLKEKLSNSSFEKYIEIFTNEGIYNIINDKLHSLEQVDKKINIMKNFYDNFTLIVDPSYFEKRETTSILGETHLLFNVEKINYKLHTNSKLSLIVEKQYFDSKMVRNDIYFKLNDNPDKNVNINVNDIFIKNEIIEFLSLLN